MEENLENQKFENSEKSHKSPIMSKYQFMKSFDPKKKIFSDAWDWFSSYSEESTIHSMNYLGKKNLHWIERFDLRLFDYAQVKTDNFQSVLVGCVCVLVYFLSDIDI